jgi:hypothetical protein
VQALLRYSDVKTTLQLYAHSVSEDRCEPLLAVSSVRQCRDQWLRWARVEADWNF